MYVFRKDERSETAGLHGRSEHKRTILLGIYSEKNKNYYYGYARITEIAEYYLHFIYMSLSILMQYREFPRNLIYTF